jgi:multicomponent Na+:H+ antiporter subunit E
VKPVRQLVLFLLLLVFWQGLSWRLDPLFLAMGVISSAAITVLSTRLLEVTIGPAATHPRVRLVALVPYTTWMLGRMFVSAMQVARIVLDPRVPPQPGIARFRTELVSPAARAMLANSITLVPGTMTLEMEGDEITIHAFTPDAADDLATAAMQNRVARVFGDSPQVPPQLVWDSGYTGRGFTIVHTPADVADDLDQEGQV